MSEAPKPVLLVQPGFAGDVFFCLKIAAEWAAKGHRVIFPVEDRFAFIPEAVEIPAGVEMPLLSTDFHLKILYSAVLQHADAAAAKGEFGWHVGPVELEEVIVLALASSWRKAPRDTMALKYQIAQVDPDGWADHVRLKRDAAREQRLLDHLGVYEGRDFVLINEACSTQNFDIPWDGDAVRMSVIDGFTLFDWAAVAERAREIVTVDTSLVLLIEVLKLTQPLQMLSRYSPPDFQPIAPLLKLNWRLALTVDELDLRRPSVATAAEPEHGILGRPRANGAIGLLALGQRLQAEARTADALTVFEHLATLRPDRSDVRLGYVGALGAEGRTLEALEQLALLRDMNGGSSSDLLPVIQAQAGPAIEKFNAYLAAGDLENAERYVSAVARLTPQAAPVLQAAKSCNESLGRHAEAARYGQMLAMVEASGQALLSPAEQADAEIARRMTALLAEPNVMEPLLRLRDIHDLASLFLCSPLDEAAKARLELLLEAARKLEVPTPAGSEWEAWATHYRMLMEALDLPRIYAPAPAGFIEPEGEFLSADGVALDWAGLRAKADEVDARAVFFVAADAAYVELYARWYALSVLRYCDVPFLVVIHVIGGQGRLDEARAQVGVDDPRVVFSGDDFDAGAVTTAAFDAPPKGRAEKPIAHMQCVRFQRLGAMLRRLERPVFVSDIDLILQRGVADLLEGTAGADVVLNENAESFNAGSRLTANLLLLNPTEKAASFADFLRGYLDEKLAGASVTRWIDQVALVMARHNAQQSGQDVAFAYFDTRSDINNIMYPSYQAHPFRFLSLYHGFDTSSLEGDPRVLDEAGEAARKRA